MKKLLDTSKMTAEEWQEYRQNQEGIGGSDVATILGLNPYKSAFALWLEKTGQMEPSDLSDNPYVEWGNILEPVVRKKFQETTGFEVFENPFVMAHDEHEFMVANIDGECVDPTQNGERGILEIKTASERTKSTWDEGPPNHYLLQVQHYMAVLDYNYAYLAVLIGGNDFRYFKIDRDDYVIDKIISAEMEFMRMVRENVAPEITSHSYDSKWLAETFPEDNDKEMDLTPELEALAVQYKELQEEIKQLTDEAAYIKNRLKHEAKEHKFLKGDSVKITIPTINKVSFDSKTFEKEHPDLFKQYKNKKTSYRSFIVSSD